jgi:hypothetical protein
LVVSAYNPGYAFAVLAVSQWPLLVSTQLPLGTDDSWHELRSRKKYFVPCAGL